jgi:hypothetical protein
MAQGGVARYAYGGYASDGSSPGGMGYTYDPENQRFNKVVPSVSTDDSSNRPFSLFETFMPGMLRGIGGGSMNAGNYGNFGPVVDSLNRQQPQPQQNQFSGGLFGDLLSKIIPEVTGGGAGQYQYNPNDQSYKKMAGGGLSSLGSYSDGGRMLKGPGDGMSDDIPAQIGKHQPARLADGEFVVPADVVSHLGNGSTDAGAKRLYSMMDKVRHARTGNKKQGKQIKADKYLPK